MRKYAERRENVLKNAEIFGPGPRRNTRKYAEIRGNMRSKNVKKCQNMSKYAKLCQNMSKYAKICESINNKNDKI